jgi:predicted nucleic acid-binding protein
VNSRVGIDTNVLIYGFFEPESAKGIAANRLLAAASVSLILPLQVAAETIAVARRKRPDLEDDLRSQVLSLLSIHTPVETSLDVLTRAVELSRRDGFQIYDALIIAASASAGATLLLSEDMQDGRSIAGLRILNPFASANQAQVRALFS